MDFVFELWDAEYREAQYAALEYLQKHHKGSTETDKVTGGDRMWKILQVVGRTKKQLKDRQIG